MSDIGYVEVVNDEGFILEVVEQGPPGSADAMGPGDLLEGTAGKLVTTDGIYVDSAFVNLGTLTSTITPNLQGFLNAYGTLPAGGGTVAFANPSTPGKPGTGYYIELTQGAAASTLQFGDQYYSEGGVPIVLTPTPGAVDGISILCRAINLYRVSVSRDWKVISD